MTPRAPISVIVPHHNRSHLIGCALASIRNQSVQPAEILIVDDASDPKHRAALSSFADIARIIWLEENGGPARARNAGVQAATSEFLAFLDDDDLWATNKLEVQWRILQDSPDLAAVTASMAEFGDDGRTVQIVEGHSPEIMTLEAALEANTASLESMLIRSSVIRALNGFDASLKIFEDQDFWIRLTAAGYKAMHLREPLVRVRRGSHQSLTRQWWSYNIDHLRVVAKHRRLYREVMGPGAAWATASKDIRRAGLQAGRIWGRVVYAFGCVLGGAVNPLMKLLFTGRMPPVPYSRDGCVAPPAGFREDIAFPKPHATFPEPPGRALEN